MSQTLFEFDSVPELISERVMMRGIRPKKDLAALFDLFSDPVVAKYTDTGPFRSADDAVEVMDWISEIFTSHRGLRWAVALRSDPETMIGTCGFNAWHHSNNSAEIGYDLMQSYWGTGITTEAVRTMIRFGFDKMQLNRIEADVTVGNDASGRVLEKLGFTEEGLLRQRGHWKGKYHDLRLFGLLRQDWDA